MTTERSIAQLLAQVRHGKSQAALELWRRYYDRLLRLARKKLRDAPRRVADEEDVVLCAFEGFLRAASEGRYPDLKDRRQLWRLLVTITERKALHQLQWQFRRKRGGGEGGREVGKLVLFAETEGAVPADEAPGHEPTPEFAALLADECRRLYELLRDKTLQTVARLKMEGYTNAEIAERIDRTERTVERKLKLIREIWSDEA